MRRPAVVREHDRQERALYNLRAAAREFGVAHRAAAELVARGPEDDAALEPALEAMEVVRAASDKLEAAALKYAELVPARSARRRRRR